MVLILGKFMVLILGKFVLFANIIMMHYKLTSVANRSDLQVYLYYLKQDIFMRTLTLSYVGENGIVGCLLMFLILNAVMRKNG